jgi:hypothetical protein
MVAAAPVTAYFAGGTITKVIVDVSGESNVDLELEAMAAFKRD